MFRLFVFCCLVMSLSIIVQANAKPERSIGFFHLTSSFVKINKYLVDKLSDSNDTESNLEALRDLVATEESKRQKHKFKALFMGENVQVKVAKGIVHLIELANDDNKMCDGETIHHLKNLFYAHNLQFYITLPRRLNIKTLERIDDLLDPKLDTIVAKCQLYYHEIYHQKWAQLKNDTKKAIELALNEEVLNQLDEIRHDHRIMVTRLAKQLDGDNYRALLESQDETAFVKYYKNFYEKHFLMPCRIYKKQMADLMEAVSDLDNRCDEFKIPIKDRSKEFSLARTRWTQCSLFEPYLNEDRSGEQAHEIFYDYVRDVNDKMVKWEPSPTHRRLFGGLRLY